MDTLVASGIPIDGERGVGYLLRELVFLPPMTLSLAELEALHLGMAIVSEAADEELQDAAKTVLNKVSETVSNRHKIPKTWGFGVYPFAQARLGFTHTPKIRTAIRDSQVLRITYHSLDDKLTTRLIRPLQTEYWGRVWTCSAWCELKSDFRAFRIDRIETCEASGRHFVAESGKSLKDYIESIEHEKAN